MVLENLTTRKSGTVTPVVAVERTGFAGWLKKQTKEDQAWLKSVGFRAEPGQTALVSGKGGTLKLVVVGTSGSLWDFAGLPSTLPKGKYVLEAGADADVVALGWALGAYRFDRYRKTPRAPAVLVWPADADKARVTLLAEGIKLARDLINTPASDLGPEELAQAAVDLAASHDAKAKVIVGAKLLSSNYPAVHAVGRASSRAPRLVDFSWGARSNPRVTLVGKGVCFDSGGLDLKSAGAMKLMKKDMGGAALVLGLAHAIMAAKLPVRLRVLVPAVENSVSGNAMRPLDVLSTRKGLTVEVGNTDAEGRLILADALAEGDGESPALLLDAATLTGAARVALGTGLPALFSTDDAWAEAILAAGREVQDPLWRMPLHDDYRPLLDSTVADLSSTGAGSYGGAITAALFLREFITRSRPWVHIDTMAFNLDSKPGRPQGGEAFALRALFRALEKRFASVPQR